MALPPLLAGAVKVIDTCVLPAVAVPMVGAPGTVTGVTLADAPDATLEPMTLAAFTLQVTAVPLVSPVTVMGDAVPVAVCVPQVAV